jgi:uncharacterized OB-fold protein
MTVPLYWRMQKEKYGKIREYMEGGSGKIVSHTTIRIAPEGHEGPYFVVVVEMEDGARLVGEVVDFGFDVEKDDKKNQNSSGTDLIGKDVKVVFRRLRKENSGLISYGYKFVIC